MEEVKNEKNKKDGFVLEDELDLRLVINFILRNKFIVSKFALFFFVGTFIFSLTLKRVWEGQFQIVLNSKSSDNSSLVPLNRLTNFNQNQDLKTEVGILESPSILEPIYQYVLKKKDSKNNKKISYNYFSWKNNNLKIKLKDGTSILNISYKDTDKELIVPVLDKMTSAYQNYSGRNKKRMQQLKKSYLIEQIDLYKERSSKSLKNAQNFAIDQDLVFADLAVKDTFNFNQNNFPKNATLNSPNLLLPNVGIENVRANAANQIRRIDIQLGKINQLNNFEELQYIGSSIPALLEEQLPQKLKKIEEDLVELRTIYKDTDKTIINLLKSRDRMINLLKERAIKYLKIARIEAEATMEAAMRPKGVILKYKELIRKAERDESTLISLENQYRSIKLEEAKTEDPWELITKPTLLKNPVAPSRKLISFTGLIIGFFAGCLIAFLNERKSGRIFDIINLEKIFQSKIIEKIKSNEIIFDSEKILFLSQFLKNISDSNLGLIFLGNPLEKNIKNLFEVLEKNIKKEKEFKLISINNLSKESYNLKNNLLLVHSGDLQTEEIKKLKNRFEFLNLKILGIIVLED